MSYIMNYMIVPGLNYMPKQYNYHRLIDDFCFVTKISLEDLKSPTRLRSIAQNRQILMYLITKNYRIGTCELAKEFNRTHATSIYAVRQVENLAKTDKYYRADLEDIAKRLITKSGQAIKY